ncbi:hypothetical protein [Thalassospira lucentensis]|uniref:hypothetical protein n=1 Tax=Thalassospira lucentensis TaxID=168935 RepID=UPI003D2C8534
MVSWGGSWLNHVRVADADADLPALAAKLEAANPGSVERVELPANKADRLAFIRNWQKENAGKAKTGMAMTLMLPLVACGGGGGGGSTSSGGAGTGFAIKGALEGADVEYWNGTEWVAATTTAADGSFSMANIPDGADIRVTGGVDTTTGQAWAGELSATAGSTYVTPLSTLVKARVDAGDTEADANAAIKEALGLSSDADLGQFDPNDDPAAYLASVKVAAVALVASAGGAGDFGTVLTNLANDLKTAADADQSLEDVLNAGGSSLYGGVAGLYTVINNVETLFDSIDTTAGDAFDNMYDALRYVSDEVKASTAFAADGGGGFGSVTVAADITSVPDFNTVVKSAVISDAPENGVYLEGDVLKITVTLSEEVTISDGTPQIKLNLGTGGTVYATYDASESDGDTLVFTYTVGAGGAIADADGIEIGSIIDVNGATLTEDDGDATSTGPRALPPISGSTTYFNSVPEGTTLSISAANADGKVIGGDGTVAITGLEDTPGADLSGISAASVTVSLDSTDGVELAADASLGTAVVNISGTGAVTIADGATLGTASFVVEDGATLSLKEARADGLTVSGAGNVNIADLAADTDLSALTVTGTVAATVSTSIDITANSNLGAVDQYSVATGQVLTMTAAQADGLPITGEGSVVINDADGDTAYDFSGIDATATLQIGVETNLNDDAVLGDVEIAFTSDVQLTLTVDQVNGRTITGTGDLVIVGEFGAEVDLSGIASTVTFELEMQVSAGQTLVLSESQADDDGDGLSVTGEGNVKVNGLAGDTDLTGIEVTGDVVAAVENNIDISANTNLEPVTQYQVAAGNTLTISADQADDLDAEGIVGDGNVTVAAIADATDFSGIDIGGTLILTVTGDVNLTTNTTLNAQLADSIEIQVAAGQTVTLTAAQANGVAITGDGGVTIESPVATDADLTGIAVTGTVNLPDNVNADVTLTLTAAQADGEAIGGDGTVAITGLDSTLAVDLSSITAAVTAAFDADGTFTGNLGTASVTVASAATMTLAASVADGATIAGDGTVVITALDSTLDADLSSITANTVTAALDSTGGVELAAGVDLGSAAITVSGNGTVTLADGATLGTSTFEVGTDATLSLTAAQADSLTVTGAGTVTITGLDGDAAYDFSGIAATTITAFTLTGDLDLDDATVLGDVPLVVDTPDTLTLTLEQANGANVSGTGTLEIAGDIDGELDITGISVSNFDISNVAEGGTLTLTAAQADGSTIAGAGTVAITGLEDTLAADLSGITAATVTAALDSTGGVELAAGVNLGSAAITVSGNGTVTLADGATLGTSTFEVGTDATLSLTAAQADGLTVTGAGTVTITGLEDTLAADLSGITAATVTAALDSTDDVELAAGVNLGSAAITVSGNGTVTLAEGATLGTSTFEVGTDATLSLTAAQADGLTVTGAGTVTITGLDGDAAYDFSGIAATTITPITLDGDLDLDDATVLGDVSLVVNDPNTLTLTPEQVENSDVSGTGTVVVAGTLSDDDTLDISDLGVTNITLPTLAGGTLTLTADQANGKVITGTGTVNIVEIGGGDYDLSGIDGALSVTFDGASSLELASNAAVTADIAHVAAWTVTDAADGTLTVTGIEATSDIGAALANVTLDGGASIVVAEFAGTMTFTGNVTGVDFIKLAADADVSMASDIAGLDDFTGLAGSGSITFTGSAEGDVLDVSDLDRSGFTGTLTVQGGDGVDHIYGTAGNDILEGGAGDDRLHSNGGVDTLLGGEGDDRIYVSDFSALGNGSEIDGGDGRNMLRVGAEANDTIDLTGSALTTAEVTVSNIDRIDLTSDVSGLTIKIDDTIAASADKDQDGTLGDIGIASRIFDVNDQGLAVQNNVTIDASGLTGTNSVYIEGGIGTDDVGPYGGFSGDDTMLGGAGDDVIAGGLGGDHIEGGAGADTFVAALGADIRVSFDDRAPAEGDVYTVTVGENILITAIADENDTLADVLGNLASYFSGTGLTVTVNGTDLVIAGDDITAADVKVSINAEGAEQTDVANAINTDAVTKTVLTPDEHSPVAGDRYTLTVGEDTYTVDVVAADASGNQVLASGGISAVLTALAAQSDDVVVDGSTLVVTHSLSDAVAINAQGVTEEAVDGAVPVSPTTTAVTGEAAVAQQTTLTFSTDGADYVDGGTLSVTINEHEVTANVTAGDAAASITALVDAINAAFGPGGTQTDGLLETIDSAPGGVITLTASEGGETGFTATDASVAPPDVVTALTTNTDAAVEEVLVGANTDQAVNAENSTPNVEVGANTDQAVNAENSTPNVEVGANTDQAVNAENSTPNVEVGANTDQAVNAENSTLNVEVGANTDQAVNAENSTPNDTGVSQVDTVSLSGTYEAGDIVSIQIDALGAVEYEVLAEDLTANGADGSGSDTIALANIAAKVVAAINADVPSSGVVTAAEGVDGSFTLEADTPGTPFNVTESASNRPAVAQVDTVSLSGTYEAGDIVSIQIDALGAVEYEVLAEDLTANGADGSGSDTIALANIAAKVVAAINADVPSSGVVTAAEGVDGSFTLEADTPGTPFNVTESASNRPAVSQVDTVSLSGTYEAGDIVSIQIDALGAVEYEVLAEDLTANGADGSGSDTIALANIAAKVVAAINADVPSSGVVTAAEGVDGSFTLEADTPGTPFNVTESASNRPAVSQVDTVSLSGTYEAGDIVSIQIDALGAVEYEVLAEDLTANGADGSGSDTIALANIAAKVVAAINADVPSSGVVTAAEGVDGSFTLEADTPGTPFNVTESASNRPAVAQVDTVSLSGTYEAGDIVSIQIDALGAVEYEVLAEDLTANGADGSGSDTIALANIAAKVVAAINADVPSSGVVTAAEGVDGSFTLEADTPGTPFNVTESASNRPAVEGEPQVSTFTLSTTDGDYVENGTLSLTINGEVISVDHVTGSATDTISNLITAINTSNADSEGLNGLINNLGEGDFSGGVLTVTGAQDGASFAVSGEMSVPDAADAQTISTTVDGENAVVHEVTVSFEDRIVAEGDIYAIEIGGGDVYSVTAADSETLEQVLGRLATQVATSSAVAGAVVAGTTGLTLSGAADGTTFTVADVDVYREVMADIADDFEAEQQVVTLTFDDNGGEGYDDGTFFYVRLGDNEFGRPINDDTSTDMAKVVSDIAAQINSFYGETVASVGGTGNLTLTVTLPEAEAVDTVEASVFAEGAVIDAVDDPVGGGDSHSTLANMDHIADFSVADGDVIDLQGFGGDAVGSVDVSANTAGDPLAITWSGSVYQLGGEDITGANIQELISNALETLDLDGDDDSTTLDAVFLQFSGGAQDGETYVFVDNGDGTVDADQDLFINLTGSDIDNTTDLSTVFANT